MSNQSTGEQRHSQGGSQGTLKTVSQDDAFYFYRGVGQSLNTSAKSLTEFVEIVQDIDPASVQFHLERGDFEHWFKFLGEQSLANQVSGLRNKNISAQELRTEVCLTVGSRINELQRRQQQQGSGGNQGTGSAGRSGSASSARSTG
jgi:Family of unknown function (DUF5752)